MEGNTKITEDEGRAIFAKAKGMAVEKYKIESLISEHDFFAGVMFVLQEVSDSVDNQLASWLAGPALLLFSGRSLIVPEFDEKMQPRVERKLKDIGRMAHYRDDIYDCLKDLTEIRRIGDAQSIGKLLLADVFEEDMYLDETD